jgi:23S rRNA pseudouridine1911/1915/1917 synthase
VADRMYIGQSSLARTDILNSADTAARFPNASLKTSAGGNNSEVLMDRQALHAFRLTIRHPVSGKEMQFEAPLPVDFQRTLQFLRTATHGRSG